MVRPGSRPDRGAPGDTDLVSLELVLVSDSSLVGTVQESYPIDGQTVTVQGNIDATR